MPISKALRRKRLIAWADALESGDYRQADGTLRSKAPHGGHAKYCCLGVACDLYRTATGKGDWIRYSDSDTFGFAVDGGEYDSFLPDEVVDWFGLTDGDPYLPNLDSGGEYTTAAQANDDLAWKFHKIAKAIRKLASE